MLITAPELVHLEPIVSLVESQIFATRLSRELIVQGRGGITHRPFQANFSNASRIIGRIPQRDGRGVKGCLLNTELIVTERGTIQAQEVIVGDRVFTHTGEWQEVRAVEHDVNDCYEVRGAGSFPVTVSCDHRFFGAENAATKKQERDFLPLGWHDVELLTEHQIYWATPTKFPKLPIPHCGVNDDRLDTMKSEFWWLVGRYISDGYVANKAKTSQPVRVRWCVPDQKAGVFLSATSLLGWTPRRINRDHSSAPLYDFCSTELAQWLSTNFGRKAVNKQLPAWVLGMDELHRRALLQGYLDGDGWLHVERERWEVSTASKALAIGVQLLAQSLGYAVGCTIIEKPKSNFTENALPAYRLHINNRGVSVAIDDYLVGKIKSVKPVGKLPIVNIITDDHSYLSGSIMSHNVHPLCLELDEAQDYPREGWVELTETLKRGHEGATWRAHGVTRGVRDEFYKHTQDTPDNEWTVHRFPAMFRPNWSDQERIEKIKQYGSREDPDYRRNILGLHGDATNPMFVLTRLMSNVDDDLHSEYNENEYFNISIKAETLTTTGQSIEDLIDFPTRHLSYKPKATFWCGMDVGFTVDPSEIVVFVEYRDRGAERSKLKLLSRVNLQRIGTADQAKAIIHTINFYKPRVFAMDKTGNGLPLFQLVQEWSESKPEFANALNVIKGYNFSQKITVGFDESIEVDEFKGDLERDAGIRRTVLEFASDTLRTLVDENRIELPWDADLLAQFQGSTWTSAKGAQDQYGRRMYSKGNDHVLDAARMDVLGWAQYAIEEVLKAPKVQAPVLDVFI